MRIMWTQRDPALRKSGVGNIFIKNLDKGIDNKQLYDTFNQFGNILSCKIVKNEKGESKGYGFVHFESETAATSAIEQVNGMMLQERKVFVGRFKTRDHRVKETGERNKQYTNVFIKNLPENYSEEQLNELVAKNGNPLSVKLMTDELNNSKNFGFASFANHEEADTCVSAVNDLEVEGKTLFAGRAQKKSERIAELRNSYQKRKEDQQKKYMGVNLFVKNLDDGVGEEALTEEFAAYGTITSVKIMNENGSSKGFGFVCFSSPEEANRAMAEMNGRILGSKPLYVAVAQRKEDRKVLLQQNYMRGAGNAVRQQMGQPAAFPQGAGPNAYPYGGAQMGSIPGYNGFSMSGMGMPNQHMNNRGGNPMNQRGFNNMRGPPVNMQQRGMPPMGRPGMQMGPAAMRMGQPMGGFPAMGPGAMRGMPNMNMMNMNNMRAPMPNMGMQQSGYKLGNNVRNAGFDQNQLNNQMANMNMNNNQANINNNNQNANNSNQALEAMNNNNPGQGGDNNTDGNMISNANDSQLNLVNLARMDKQDQKQQIGEKLYPKVKEIVASDEEAGKITGMLLELDNEDLLGLLEPVHEQNLKEKVTEASGVLANHTQTA